VAKAKAHTYCHSIKSNVHNVDLVVYVVTTEFELLISSVSLVINKQNFYICMTPIEHFVSYLHLYSRCDPFEFPPGHY